MARGDRDAGFTIFELMAVVAIMGLLVTIAVASFAVSTERSRRVACVANQRLIDSALMQYQLDHAGNWPASLDDVRVYVKWPGGAFATCTADAGVHFVYDPSDGEVSCPNHPR